jgi:thiol-disulfide isomerase/thioredoxin
MNINTKITGIKHLETLIKENKGIIIIVFRAEWCNPCKMIKNKVNDSLNKISSCGGGVSGVNAVDIFIIDIDECFQIYMELKRLRILTGVPSMLCYKKDEHDIFPYDACFGSDNEKIDAFFIRLLGMLD